MTKTILNSIHKTLGAKMVPFAGYEMPIQYKKGIIEENVRENVGVFDVSHMGEVFVSGEKSLAYYKKFVVMTLKKLKLEKHSICLPMRGWSC